MSELKEFVDELKLPNNSNQIFEILSKENFDVETLLNTQLTHLQLIFQSSQNCRCNSSQNIWIN